ncbi:MAG: ABC-F family ATP-binding cassette domain-containing protein [Anaerolineaceae bacterium]|nr:ABC-F family ATP-binding cassette domain-containing protein [Anaerolineaceae bacterium]
MPYLTTLNLAKSYGPDDIFNGITVSIPKRARIGLVGSNGVGKTTLLRILVGEEYPSEGSVQKAKQLKIGYLPQESMLNSPQTLWDECRTALRHLEKMENQLEKMETSMADGNAGEDVLRRYSKLQDAFDRKGGYTYENKIERTLTGLGFEKSDFQKPLNILSGGQRTRALLAKLLLSDPDLLMLDEPTNHLDIQAMEWLEGYLRAWEGAVVLVSHDRYFLDHTVNMIWEMTPAMEIYHGNYSAYLRQREARYERQLKEFNTQQSFIKKEKDYIQRNIAGQNTRQAQGRRTRLEQLLKEAKLVPPRHAKRMHLQIQAAERSGDLVMRTHGVRVGYQDDEKVLINIPDIVLRRRECAALMGPNGAGKTTFLKTLLGQIPPLAGEVKLGGSVQVGYFAQAHEGLHQDWTLLEEIQFTASKMREAEIRSYLAKFLFTGDDVFKKVSVLSGGERGRLAMACLALGGANLLLLDEPTNHLDLPSQEILQRVLTEFNGTILLVSHDRFLVDEIATQVWEVLPDEKNMIVFKGNYSALRAEQEERKITEAAKNGAKKKTHKARQEKKKSKRINPSLLRELEAAISSLEDALAEAGKKLENPIEASESIAELGERYVSLQAELDAKWEEWHALFVD